MTPIKSIESNYINHYRRRPPCLRWLRWVALGIPAAVGLIVRYALERYT